MSQTQQKLQQQIQLLAAVSPKNILARGYSIVSDQKGHVVRDGTKLKLGQKLQIRFAQGERSVQVLPEHQQSDLFDQ